MKKFKVIEEGRILNNDELTKINGGVACTDTQQLASCSAIKFLTISPCALYMHCTNSAFSLCGSSALETCKGTQRVIIGNILT